MPQTLSAVLSLVGMLILMLLVFAGAYYLSRFIGTSATGKFVRNGNIEILERTAVNKDQTLLIVRIAGKAYLLGAASQSISMLSELDETQLHIKPSVQSEDFVSVLKHAMSKTGGRDKRQ